MPQPALSRITILFLNLIYQNKLAIETMSKRMSL